jgi:hypothetical protein
MWRAYRFEDHETGEEVEDGVKPRGDNGSHLVVGCEGHRHHAVVCEVEQGEVHDEGVVEEFLGGPHEAHHGIREQGEQETLDQAVRDLNQHLHRAESTTLVTNSELMDHQMTVRV